MDKMINAMDANPGLRRRFRFEDAFHFEDYDDDQLVTIMMVKAKEKTLYLTEDLAKAAVAQVLSKQRAKPHFGNVGAVNNLLDGAMERMSKRPDRTKRYNAEGEDGLWILIDSDLFAIQVKDAALQALSHLENADHILVRNSLSIITLLSSVECPLICYKLTDHTR